jgi:hypothetical protein
VVAILPFALRLINMLGFPASMKTGDSFVMAAEYRPGQAVLESGIYRVNHDSTHTQGHEVTAVRGEPFPPCRANGCHVTYSIVRAAHHLKEAPQLQG